MTYMPLKKDKTPIVISAILLACTAVCLLFFAVNVGNRLILQLITVISAASSGFVTARYTLSGFVYTLSSSIETDKSPSLIITRTQGIYKKAVCNLSLESAVAVIPKIPFKEIENKYGKISRRFNYCVNMFPDESYLYIFEFIGVINVIEFESNTDFYLMFKFMIGQQ